MRKMGLYNDNSGTADAYARDAADSQNKELKAEIAALKKQVDGLTARLAYWEKKLEAARLKGKL